ncbi:MAG TPA: secondary thiamine-phosphate synthase enzyme YjbQ [Actinoallomurus sp.]|jgi:secondary thiamine-phosphate synthase enzyme|nr:secondary thiamine-phosphate synthase enzyme YjbQ [Actinoallomurus sp.]
MRTEVIRVATGSRETVHDITGDCETFLSRAGAGDGLLNIFVPHATAGIALIELGSGSEVDLLDAMRALLPKDDRWAHSHGSLGHGRSHVMPAIVPPHATIPVVEGKMALGTWQSVAVVDLNVDNVVRKVRLSFMDSG